MNKTLYLLFIAALGMLSCKKEDPKASDPFIGKWEGEGTTSGYVNNQRTYFSEVAGPVTFVAGSSDDEVIHEGKDITYKVDGDTIRSVAGSVLIDGTSQYAYTGKGVINSEGKLELKISKFGITSPEQSSVMEGVFRKR